MKKITLFIIALSLIIGGCGGPKKSDQSKGQDSTAVKSSSNQKINIKAQSTDKFLCCDGHQNQKIVGNRDNAGQWEEFTLIHKGGDTVAFKAYSGKYVCADLKKGGILSADRDDVGKWESFIMIKQKEYKVAFKAFNKKYVSCDKKMEGSLIANRDSIGDWELFTVIYK